MKWLEMLSLLRNIGDSRIVTPLYFRDATKIRIFEGSEFSNFRTSIMDFFCHWHKTTVFEVYEIYSFNRRRFIGVARGCTPPGARAPPELE